ncbi:hypothetical protein [Paenibacillus illinoisensis]|uniref:hypothetical protein n=1 Tax=Paenibacillus illinoisensis TaxID=59845 RepID=UPI0030178232
MLEAALREEIRQYAEERAIPITENEIGEALKGVLFWFRETAEDSISTAIDLVKRA